MRAETRVSIDRERLDDVLQIIAKTAPDYAENVSRRIHWRYDESRSNRGKALLLEVPETRPLLRQGVPLLYLQSELLAQRPSKQDVFLELTDNNIFIASRRIRNPIRVRSARSDSILMIVNDESSDRISMMVFDSRGDLDESLDRALATFRRSRRFNELKVQVVVSRNEPMTERLEEVSGRLQMEGLQHVKVTPLEDGLRAHSLYVQPKSGFVYEDPTERQVFTGPFIIPESERYADAQAPEFVGPDDEIDFSKLKVSFPEGFEDLDLNRNGLIELDDLAKGSSKRVRDLLDRSDWNWKSTEFLVTLLVKMDAFRSARLLLGEFENAEIKSSLMLTLMRDNKKKLVKMVLAIQEHQSVHSRHEGTNAYELLRDLHPKDREEILEGVEEAGREGYADNIRQQFALTGQAETESTLELPELKTSTQTNRESSLPLMAQARHQLAPGHVARKNGTRDSSPVEFKLSGKEETIAVLVSDDARGIHFLAIIDEETTLNDVFDILFYEMNQSRFRFAQARAQVIGGTEDSLERVSSIVRRLNDHQITNIEADYGNMSRDEERIMHVNLHTGQISELENRSEYVAPPADQKAYGIYTWSSSANLEFEPIRLSLRTRCAQVLKATAQRFIEITRKQAKD